MLTRNPGNLFAPARELATLRFWQEEQVFVRSLEQRRGAPEYVFYDGPPFATGLPHYGHLLAGTIKDVVPRYQTMCGKYVERVFGWDCHGLPVENEVEKELGFTSKRDIEAYGVAPFNEACRGIVLRYTQEWERVVERMGRWVDFRRGYRTMDRDYMESIWWVFKQLWDRGLVYEGAKSMWYCPRCATPLSNFEVHQGYREVEDPAVTVRFRATEDAHTWYLAWTTTPWTLPSNLALTVGPEIEYVTVQDGDERYVMAADRVHVYYKTAPPVVARCLGRALVGKTYEPLFPYFRHLAAQGAFRIIDAGFVSTEDGTGLVHTAPGFGEDDAIAAQAHGLPIVCPVDHEVKFTAEVPDYQGRFVKDCDADIMLRLKAAKQLVHRGRFKHNYPHCWRCKAALIQRGLSTWFVRVEALKERLLAANAQIRWVPDHLKTGRFGKWLENARDWAISRNRFWGCPLPIWRSADGREALAVGSVAELEQLAGRPVADLHKHFVDDLVLRSPATGQELRRVPEVLDCWFESGSMPYAQRHYPFSQKEWLESHFPADFIAEGLDQTRGWFYTLVVLGAALFDKPAFKNVIVNGLILTEDGKAKLSKSERNYPDPEELINKYGADALRLYLLSSPVVRAEDLCFSEKGVAEMLRNIIIPFCNVHSFLTTYALVDGWAPRADGAAPAAPRHPLDQWLLSRLQAMVAEVREHLDAYELQGAATAFNGFMEQLTNWYIRRSRRRFWKSRDDDDKAQAYQTLYHALLTFCQTAAPFIPFVTEAVYQHLRHEAMPRSVHWCDFPVPQPQYRAPELEQRMAHAMTAASLGRFLRTQTGVRVRQPLRSAVLVAHDEAIRADLVAMSDLIADELNVKEVAVRADEEDLVHLSAKANFRRLGPRLGGGMKAAAAAIAALGADQIRQLRQGAGVTLTVDGQAPLPITLEDVEIRREEKADVAVANDGPITVGLDVHLDDALIAEGRAREVVHVVQNLRKEAGLDVADRINVYYVLPDSLAGAVTRHADYITGETLATHLLRVPALADGVTVDVGETPGVFKVEKRSEA